MVVPFDEKGETKMFFVIFPCFFVELLWIMTFFCIFANDYGIFL